VAPEQVTPYVLREPVSSVTHLAWCLWALGVTALLWRLARRDRGRQWAVGCFGMSMVGLYAASGIYHAVPAAAPRLVAWLRRLDHSMIYVLIAGTHTPVFAILLRGRLRIVCLVLIWSLAAVGVACKWLLPWPPYGVTVGLYVAMGWVSLVAIVPLVGAVGLRGMALALAGGLLYMAGGVCDVCSWPVLFPGVVGPHEVVHVLDMGGTLTHVCFIARYVLPFRR
jgi:hemolysin III